MSVLEPIVIGRKKSFAKSRKKKGAVTYREHHRFEKYYIGLLQ